MKNISNYNLCNRTISFNCIFVHLTTFSIVMYVFLHLIFGPPGRKQYLNNYAKSSILMELTHV